MVSILLCFALFAYVILYVISFGSIVLCYALVYLFMFPYTEKSLIKKSLIQRHPLLRGIPYKTFLVFNMFNAMLIIIIITVIIIIILLNLIIIITIIVSFDRSDSYVMKLCE